MSTTDENDSEFTDETDESDADTEAATDIDDFTSVTIKMNTCPSLSCRFAKIWMSRIKIDPDIKIQIDKSYQSAIAFFLVDHKNLAIHCFEYAQFLHYTLKQYQKSLEYYSKSCKSDGTNYIVYLEWGIALSKCINSNI